MNDADAQLLARFYDGECSPAEEDAVGALIQNDPEAVTWLETLAEQQARWENLPPVLDEVAVERDWQALKARIAPAESAPRRLSSPLAWAEYWTAGAVAAVFILASVVYLLPRSSVEAHAPTTPNIVESVETDLEGATPIVFVDQESGWSVVWVDEASAG
ncbi:hypothetical protein [Cerasicoccus frondis]|uniref:hypothetical protein n=1 Tax=Cerasicoccus frondis TaxID=490090 RepID=UPI0028528DD3|nr:hypothetical protein [Cerasicoccus frondis]